MSELQMGLLTLVLSLSAVVIAHFAGKHMANKFVKEHMTPKNSSKP